MIVDSSALVEIASGKPDAEVLMVALARPDTKRISAGNLLETWMVIDRRGIRRQRRCLTTPSSGLR